MTKHIVIICAMLVCQAQAAQSHLTLSSPDEKLPFGRIVQMCYHACDLEDRVINSVKILMQGNPVFATKFAALSAKALDQMHQENSDTLLHLWTKLLNIKKVLTKSAFVWERNSKTTSVMDAIRSNALPDLMQEPSDFETVFHRLHELGALVVKLFRFIELCADQNSVEVAVSQEHTYVESEEEAWGHLDQIPKELQGLLDNQKQELDDFRKWHVNFYGFPSPHCYVWRVIDRTGGPYEVYTEYREMVLQKFCKVVESFNEIRSVALHIRRTVQIHNEVCALEDRAIKCVNFLIQQENSFNLKAMFSKISALAFDSVKQEDSLMPVELKEKVTRLSEFLFDHQDMLLRLKDQELQDMVLKGSVPDLQEKPSDFMDVFRALHQAGELGYGLLRCVDVCIDPQDGGKTVAVSQEDICVESEEKAWEHLAKICEAFYPFWDTSSFHHTLHLRQKKNLIDLKTLLLKKRFGLECFVSDDLLKCAYVNVCTYELYEKYREIILRRFIQALKQLQYWEKLAPMLPCSQQS